MAEPVSVLEHARRYLELQAANVGSLDPHSSPDPADRFNDASILGQSAGWANAAYALAALANHATRNLWCEIDGPHLPHVTRSPRAGLAGARVKAVCEGRLADSTPQADTLHVVDADNVMIGPAEQSGSNVRLLSWRLPFVAHPDPSNGSATEQLAEATIAALREEVEDLQSQLGRLELQRDRIAASYGVLQDAVRAIQVLDIDAAPGSRRLHTIPRRLEPEDD